MSNITRTAVLAAAAASLVAGSTLAIASPAAAEERVCRGSIGATTVDNLRVPQGATCTLNGTRVQGTVLVERNATLSATDIRTIGNVQAEGHRRVVVRLSEIGGSIQLKQGGSASLTRNAVDEDVQSFTNTGAQTFNRNRIDGNLQCKENVPAPTGSGNVVQGNKEDQCAGL